MDTSNICLLASSSRLEEVSTSLPSGEADLLGGRSSSRPKIRMQHGSAGVGCSSSRTPADPASVKTPAATNVDFPDSCDHSRSDILLKVFPLLQDVAARRQSHQLSFTFEQFDEVVRSLTKKNISNQLLGQFLFLQLLSAEWRNGCLYIALPQNKPYSLMDQKKRIEYLKRAVLQYENGVPPASLPARPTAPEERSAKSLLEEARVLFQKKEAIEKEKNVEPTREKGYEGLRLKLQRKKVHQEDLKLFSSAEEEQEERS